MPRVLFPVALLLVPSLAAADHVTVKGTVLEGKVKAISSKQIVMETVYGKGDLTIPTADVSAIETDVPFHVFQADDGVAVGKVVGITPAAVTVAEETGGKEVPFANVQAAPRDAGPDANWFARRPMESPWWHSHFDFAFSATDSTISATALAVGFGATRERGPSRLKLGASYIRETTQNNFAREDNFLTPGVDESEDGSKRVTGDELRGFIRQEYDVSSRVFGFSSLDAEHDGIEQLAFRLIPKVGAGYKIVKTETSRLAVDAGIAFVYESFYAPHHNAFTALALGAEHSWKLPWLGASWNTRVDYLPSLSAFLDDYRLSGQTGLTVPLFEQLSLKASLIDSYNSQPADDTAANSLTTLLGLSLFY
jgi:hypothetical protein